MKVRGLQHLDTTAMEAGLPSIPRGQDGALKELSQLMRDRWRLTDQKQMWQTRIDHINTRLARIAAREEPLLRRVARSGRAIAEKYSYTSVRKPRIVPKSAEDLLNLARAEEQAAEETNPKKKRSNNNDDGVIRY